MSRAQRLEALQHAPEVREVLDRIGDLLDELAVIEI